MHAFLEALHSLDALAFVFLLLAIALALAFEFVNGFHDTANAVATVIYTNSLRPTTAVIWSGVWNFIGVVASGGLVAYSIVALLPVELVLNVGSETGFAMVFSLLLSAILWNLGTWYLGLPASSSHTLIGAIMGVGLANAMLCNGGAIHGINWVKAKEVGMALLFSPLVGFLLAALLLLAMKLLLKRQHEVFSCAAPGRKPPFWVRATLVLTCTGVSFAHGSNDGQKGQGLIVLILVGLLPGAFALRMDAATADLRAVSADAALVAKAFATSVEETPRAKTLQAFIKGNGGNGGWDAATQSAFAGLNGKIASRLAEVASFEEIPKEERGALRSDIYLADETIGKLLKRELLKDPAQIHALKDYKKRLDGLTKYVPNWVKVAVALALGLGTMIGWKRIVVTVGEKIGKDRLSYAQGAAAELVAMGAISAAGNFGLPVSTTHVLCSAVAGSMAANGSGLQKRTIRHLLLAWLLTLPVCIFMGAAFFAIALLLLLHGVPPTPQ